MSPVQSTDLLLINRTGVDYKAPLSQVKDGVLGSHVIQSATPPTLATHPDIVNGTIWVDTSQSPPVINVWDSTANGGAGGWEEMTGGAPKPVNPAPTDFAANPAFVSGTGTQADPFIITPSTVAAPGGTVQSAQQLTLTGQKEGAAINWVDNSVGVGNRFQQAGGAVPAGGTVNLRLSYLDTPNSTADQNYTGNLQLGTTYFKWVVTQQVIPALAANATTQIAGVTETGAALTATAGTATGGTAPITYATKWQVSADGATGWTDTGTTGLSYTIQAGDLNKYLRAVTTATDSTAPTAQTLELPSASSAKVTAPVAVTLGWNADTDVYTRDPAANRIIDVHARIRRCLLTNAGVATYLDADDSTKLAGDWLRLCETAELNTAYTGTFGAEVANLALRASAPAWAAGTYTKGQRVISGGSVWECIAASTTATPAAGTAAATLTGATAQVMVEIPRFSVWHETAAAGSYKQHTFHLTRGTKVGGGYAVHPSFIKPDGSYRDFIYVGAYQGTGTNGNGSASGVNNTVNMTRAACRTACSGRGAGWHQLGYWEYNALQWLLITEYQDMNSQRVLGNGSMTGNVYVVPTGLSNARGNRSANAHTAAGANTDYVSYRGVENFYGRAWQWLDGINLDTLAVYLCNNPAQWADDTASNYIASGSVPAGGGAYQRDVMSGIELLPSSVTGASDTTYTGDALWTGSGWRVAKAGGVAGRGGPVGALCLDLDGASSGASAGLSGRLCYAV